MTGSFGQWPDLARGAALGLAIAAPVGPTALLCIQRTLAGGMLAGMATGYGAATTHMGYGAAAAAGLLMLMGTVAAPWLAALLQAGCTAFLMHLAVRTMRRPAPTLAASYGCPLRGRRHARPWRCYALGLAWTLGNPMTLLGFAALSPGFLRAGAYEASALPGLATGVFLGSAAWWTALAACVALARGLLTERGLQLANMVTGMLLALVAVGMLARTVSPWVGVATQVAGPSGAPALSASVQDHTNH